MRLIFALLVLVLLSRVELRAEQEVKTGPKTLAEAAAQLQKGLKESLPNEATAALVAIPRLWGSAADEKEQKACVALVGKAAGSKDLRIRHGAFATLGEIRATGSSRYLKKWLNPPKKFKGEIPPSYLEGIRAAGRIADNSTLSKLQKLSNHQEIVIARAATAALGGYHVLTTKRRKALAFELVKRLERLSAKQRRKQNEAVYARKAALGEATVRALQGITGKKFTTLEGWQGWRDRAEKDRDPFD